MGESEGRVCRLGKMFHFLGGGGGRGSREGSQGQCSGSGSA